MISIGWQPAEELDSYVEAQQAGRPVELLVENPQDEYRLAEWLFQMSAVVFPGVQFVAELENQIHAADWQPAEIVVR